MYNKNIMQNDFYTGLTKSEINKIDQTFFIINNSYFKNQLENQTSQNSLPTEFHQQTEEKPIRRDTARCIILNSNHEICLLYSRAKDYFAIPGGGIEPGETLLQAVNREILEETGYTIDNIKPLGKIYEERNYRITNTYFFYASPLTKSETHYMQDELEEDYRLVWLPVEQAIKKLETRFQNLKNHQFPSHKGSFINVRNLEALKYFHQETNFWSKQDRRLCIKKYRYPKQFKRHGPATRYLIYFYLYP